MEMQNNSKKFLDRKEIIPYFTNSKRTFFDSTSFTLIRTEVIESILNFYTQGATKQSIGLNTGTYLANLALEDTRSRIKSFFSFSGEAFFPQNRSIGILTILYSMHSFMPELKILAYSGLEHDIWIPIFEFSRTNNIKLNSVPYFVSNDEIINNVKISNGSISNNRNTVIILPLRSMGSGLEVKKEILYELKNKFGLTIVLECSHAICTKPYNFDELTFDFLIFDSNIGFGGPSGQGVVFFKPKFKDMLKPYFIIGNNSVKNVKNIDYTLEKGIEKLETGLNISTIVGLNTALDLLTKIGLSAISSHIFELKNYLILSLKSKFSTVVIIGSENQKDYHNIVSFVFPNVNMHEIAIFLDEVHSIDLRSGSFCAHQLIEQIYKRHTIINNHSGIIQISLHYYNNKEDLDKLLEGLTQFFDLIK